VTSDALLGAFGGDRYGDSHYGGSPPFHAITSNGTTVTVVFDTQLRVDGIADLGNYAILASGNGAFPVSIIRIDAEIALLQSGADATVVDPHTVSLPTGNNVALQVGNYVFLGSPLNPTDFLRITGVPSPGVVTVDKPLIVSDPMNGTIPWHITTAVTGVTMETTKLTNAGFYTLHAEDLHEAQSGNLVSFDSLFIGVAPKPQVVSATPFADGQIVVTFTDPMLDNPTLTNPTEYTVTGPTSVKVVSVNTLSPNQVLLTTIGMGAGSYTVTVNANGTPHDSSGNPMDPTFNQAVFTGSLPLTARSIFVNKGPITKPPLSLQTGATATILDATTVSMPTASLVPSMVGLSLKLTGTATNGGTYLIKSIVSATRAKVTASFHLPDPSNGSITWEVFDPRDGEIADDPLDVTVRINGVPTPAQSVIGLLGQIVMASPPAHGSTVAVDYHWMANPTVDFRRMNSREFRFNNWNRDVGRPNDPSRHKYRFNNTMVQPSSFVPLDMRAVLAQPLQRDLKYRAYERAYTAVMNDPHLLLFNSPTQRIAFPPLSRPLEPVFINYQATVLPQNEPTNPWTLHGSGSANIVNNELIVSANSPGPFPTGEPIFWTRPIDLTFPHVFASSWRMTLTATPTTDGVFTGVAAGFSDGEKCVVVGFLDDAGTKKIGILKAGAGNDPSNISAWTGGVDGSGNPTNAPVPFDWSIIHSYRLFQDTSGIIHVFVDGSVVNTLRVLEDELPFLSELNEPFNELQGVFFGSMSRLVANTTAWDFLRYEILPTNPAQSAPSVFVTYEADILPEQATMPWTPVGSHGTETILNDDLLILDSTSATDQPTETLAGLVDGDFRGFVRLEPLLQAASSVALDVNVQLRTFTHGIAPNAAMFAVDDGNLLIQTCFFPDTSSPLFSYGGRSFPDAFQPYTWSKLGGETPSMVGQILRITDGSTTDGLLYFIDDTSTPSATTRVVSSLNDYVLEFRVRVNSHAADVGGFAGVNGEVYDSLRDLGVILRDVAGVKSVALHSEGTVVANFAFNWDDGQFHTYRMVKSTGGNLVTLFIDTVLIGTAAYSSFSVPAPSAVGVISFGSTTPISVQSTSVADWAYCNVWRVNTVAHHYVGIWKGTNPNSLIGYHLPLKAGGRGATIVGNTLTDTNVNFLTAGVAIGDDIVVDVGPNEGVYRVATVVDANNLTITAPFPFQPSAVDYRIPKDVDWTTPHRYRLLRDPSGGVALFLDTQPLPLIALDYNNSLLPPSSAGLPSGLAGGLPSMVWGAFDPMNLSQTAWDYVRYGITRPQSELQIVPHHQVMNQRNVMASFEHHLTNIPHSHTDFWSESEGIPPQTDPDFLKNTNLQAYTLLNEGTPLVPSTQTYEVRRPTPQLVSVVGFNRPEDLLNSQSFVMNESEQRVELLVPNDVLYNSLQVIERDTGEPNHIAPFDDETNPIDLGTLSFQHTTCLTYTGDVLPENDTSAPTPWSRQSDDDSHAFATAFAGILTYGTDPTGTRTIYRNATPLTDQISLQTEVKFRLKVLNDASGGLGDSHIRFGFSSPGLTMALAFVTSPLGQRYVLVYDLNSLLVVGGLPFDFNDGNYHVYRLVRDPATATVQVFIDS
jgi:hypothetical protein